MKGLTTSIVGMEQDAFHNIHRVVFSEAISQIVIGLRRNGIGINAGVSLAEPNWDVLLEYGNSLGRIRP